MHPRKVRKKMPQEGFYKNNLSQSIRKFAKGIFLQFWSLFWFTFKDIYF